jgi:uncharacterized protein
LRTDAVADRAAAAAGATARHGLHHPTRLDVFTWARRLHVYISMGTLLLVLFFALTGITLNHPEIAFGSQVVRTDVAGEMPEGWRTAAGTDWLAVAETLRHDHGVRGRVTDRYEDALGGQLSFRAPGYASDLFFDARRGTFELVTESEGWVAVLNDLHRGRNAGAVWSWVVDLSAAFLVLVAMTGLVLLMYLRKIRPAGLIAALLGSVAAVALGVWAVG